MSWDRGRAEIERLLRANELQRITASDKVASRLLRDAEAHIGLAGKGIEDDPAGALQLSYDAGRKASAALLAVQGLRSTTRGGHVAVIQAVRAQFDNRGMEVFGRLDRLRRRRNSTEYPDSDSPTVSEDDARQSLVVARNVLDTAQRLLQGGQLEAFE